ncbi:MAG: DUF2400 family protein [Chitinophagia bacterium]|nr:DUF2400 family protein [Chitinophagia bacterium]
MAHEACKLSLLPNEKLSWKNAIQLTELCSLLNPTDPTFYDYAFFGMGVNGSLYGDSAIDGTLF